MSFYQENQLKKFIEQQSLAPMFDKGLAEKLIIEKESQEPNTNQFAVGGYLENRRMTYTQERYQKQKSFIHLGLDILIPAKSSVFVPWPLRVFDRAYLREEGDYGYCIVGQFVWPGPNLYFLMGHLDKKTFFDVRFGKTYQKGEKLAQVGDFHENGYWPPHLHFQLSFLRPEQCDMKGTCEAQELEFYAKIHPDPSVFLKPHLQE